MSNNKSVAYDKLILFLCLFLFMISCVSTNQDTAKKPTVNLIETDQSWLNGKPCTVPCWYGLELGGSDEEDLKRTVGELSFLSQEPPEITSSEYWSDLNSDYHLEQMYKYKCKSPPNTYCNYLIFRNNSLYQILIYPNFRVTFSEAVDKLGIPDGFLANRTSAEAKGCIIMLIWEQRQLMILYNEGRISPSFRNDLCDRINQASNKIPSDLIIHSVNIIEKDHLQDLIGQSGYISWNGFEIVK